MFGATIRSNLAIKFLWNHLEVFRQFSALENNIHFYSFLLPCPTLFQRKNTATNIFSPSKNVNSIIKLLLKQSSNISIAQSFCIESKIRNFMKNRMHFICLLKISVIIKLDLSQKSRDAAEFNSPIENFESRPRKFLRLTYKRLTKNELFSLLELVIVWWYFIGQWPCCNSIYCQNFIEDFWTVWLLSKLSPHSGFYSRNWMAMWKITLNSKRREEKRICVWKTQL